jgi:hypothetical protein
MRELHHGWLPPGRRASGTQGVGAQQDQPKPIAVTFRPMSGTDELCRHPPVVTRESARIGPNGSPHERLLDLPGSVRWLRSPGETAG